MSEGVALAQTFADRSRFRTNFRGAAYTRREVKLTRYIDGVSRDIKPRTYRPAPQTKRHNLNFASRKLAQLVLNNLIASAEISVPPETSRSPASYLKLKPFKVNVRGLLKARSRLQLAIYGLSLLLVIGGSYMSFTSWQDNQAVKAQATKLTAVANKAALSSTGSATTSDTNQALSTVKPTPKTVAAYAVAPNDPKYLKIPAIGVDSIVGQAGILASGALGTPSNVYYTDWYTGSALPGQPGATLIDGHVSSWTAEGVFYNLHKLVAGDTIQIIKGDNSVVNYQVVSTEVYNSNNVNMQAAITPVVPGISGLNLITCTGQVIKGTSLFNERVIVFAKEV